MSDLRLLHSDHICGAQGLINETSLVHVIVSLTLKWSHYAGEKFNTSKNDGELTDFTCSLTRVRSMIKRRRANRQLKGIEGVGKKYGEQTNRRKVKWGEIQSQIEQVRLDSIWARDHIEGACCVFIHVPSKLRAYFQVLFGRGVPKLFFVPSGSISEFRTHKYH